MHATAPPEVINDLRRRGLLTPLAMGGVAATGCLAIGLANPGDDGIQLCTSRILFGVDCAFCGGIRCTNSLLRGDFLAAADHNVILAVALPLVAIAWVVVIVKGLRSPALGSPGAGSPGVEPPPADQLTQNTWWVWRIPTWATITAGVALVAFGVIRNLDLAPWMVWLHSDTF